MRTFKVGKNIRGVFLCLIMHFSCLYPLLLSLKVPTVALQRENTILETERFVPHNHAKVI